MLEEPDLSQIALSIQQPWAELILQGIKTLEIRAMPTRIRGPVYLYTSRQFSRLPSAREAVSSYNLERTSLPRGVIVGTVNILDCRPAVPNDSGMACVPADVIAGNFSWILGNAKRSPQLWSVTCAPFGPWFYPFQRRGS